MNFKEFKTYGIIMTIGVLAIVGWAISRGQAALTVALIVIWVFVVHIMRRKVDDEPLHDERVFQVGGKAARRTIQVMALGMGLTGAAIMLSEDLYSQYRQAAITFAYSVAALAFVYNMFYMYYNHRPPE